MREPRDLIRHCLDRFNEGRIEEADRVAEEAVLEYPDDGELWQLRGLIRQRLADLPGACEAFETASLLVPLSTVSQCALADCHAKAGRRDLAKQLYRDLARNRPCPTDLLPAVASGLGCVGDPETALDVCRELAWREPTRHEAFFGMAYYMRRLGHDPAAILPVIAKAHQVAPEVPVYRVMLALLQAQFGRYAEACDLLRDARPESVRCGTCLRRILAVLDEAGAADLRLAYQARLEAIDDPGPGRSD